jgi:hypothetical protein
MQGIKRSYEEWKQCLFGENGQKFSKDFIRARLKVMTDSQHPETQNFIRVYGEDYTRQIAKYFERALKELK